jgi:hypothetical protein
MSRYKPQPIDPAQLHTVPLETRGGKVRIDAFAKPHERDGDWITFLASLPNLLAADSLRAVIEAIVHARLQQREIIWGLGGHVIKTGLAPILIDLMKRGFATAFAMNGSAAIHDFEIALAGATSEDVEAVLPDGSFGSAEETGREMNHALDYGVRHELGAGEAYGRRLAEIARPEFRNYSLLHAAYEANVPVTVHIAIGTDTPHTHPAANGAAIGVASLRDFRLFCALVRDLEGGGVYINAGSAVVLPEVFLKAVSTVRNLGNPLSTFTTVNMDFLQHYRPKANVIERPHAGGAGQGYSLTGHHEIMIPLLAACLVECSES